MDLNWKCGSWTRKHFFCAKWLTGKKTFCLCEFTGFNIFLLSMAIIICSHKSARKKLRLAFEFSKLRAAWQAKRNLRLPSLPTWEFCNRDPAWGGVCLVKLSSPPITLPLHTMEVIISLCLNRRRGNEHIGGWTVELSSYMLDSYLPKKKNR